MFLEGSRTFDIAWGATTAAMCFAIGFPLLWWFLPKHRVWFFGRRIDPKQRLQIAYGFLCMAMVGTNLLCRVIDHGYLEFVHPVFALITLLLVAGITPRLLAIAWNDRKRRTAAQPHAAR